MDIYTDAVEHFAGLPAVQDWQMLQDLFKKIAGNQPHGWDLPIAGALTVGAKPELALPGVAALGCAQTAIILIDDMLDEDPRGEYTRIGYGQASNLAAAFQAAGLLLLADLDVDAAICLEAQLVLNQMLAQTAHGQYLDLQNFMDEEGYWRVVQMKSSPFYRCGMQLGAVLAGASHAQHTAVGRFGALYGEMIQIHDDLKDTMAPELNPDWVQKRFPLPILFASLVDHPQQARFWELRQKIEAPGALTEAQEIILSCGAVSYCFDQLMNRFARGRALIEQAGLPNPEPLTQLLDDLMQPVEGVFESLGLDVEPALAEYL